MVEETNKGLVMVYTGDGKGKTTAAVGQALRALGHGFRVYMIHFMKGRDYGEFLAAEKLPRLTVDRAGRDCFVNRENPDPVDIELAREGFSRAVKAVKSGDYDLVVLDEINVAVDYGLIPEAELLKLLEEKPPGVDLILTGRGASPELIKRADMVSEVLMIKHHYNSGVAARKGIEY
ncbi:MAG TPA: cob(I)yrinic acid a,c-diamide adenosyltransferase [Bacillota bacterium]|nr:cob(I)yrinic acid a,c-diamide adenosyltransferase [Bacillota bacterium]HOA36362.1 cob(I)yrinic acid a,c-diamide adenosyltransferase [Bacillota bacterium]HOJ84824.1 cob(I)yrinic acid a,c-diamide adenosyltransferase [Bacillota bacterium]HOL14814.1 cob(I)yrinic acid a,c-diamide adenosyltransferase [Bacillota bacterium]HPZ12343.1 cob(I)yrinic acid a,c-diamide adenosyltransferase [Bacillota bacterium]